jgi:DNA-binding transcriptional MerR regulator
VARITGIPWRTLDYWAKRGILKPSIQDASGTGTFRIYSFDDLVGAKDTKK